MSSPPFKPGCYLAVSVSVVVCHWTKLTQKKETPPPTKSPASVVVSLFIITRGKPTAAHSSPKFNQTLCLVVAKNQLSPLRLLSQSSLRSLSYSLALAKSSFAALLRPLLRKIMSIKSLWLVGETPLSRSPATSIMLA